MVKTCSIPKYKNSTGRNSLIFSNYRLNSHCIKFKRKGVIKLILINVCIAPSLGKTTFPKLELS